MQAERRAQISLYLQLKELFESSSIWTTPFTVYGRNNWSSDFQGVFPFVFIVNADPAPDFQIQHTPVIVIETSLDVFSMEIGGGKFGILKFAYHVFSNSGAQRDDICGTIIGNQGIMVIRDPEQVGSPIIETHPIIANAQGEVWSSTPISYSPFAPEWYTAYTRYGRILSSAIEIAQL